MTAPWWLTAACLVGAAGIAGWPAREQRARRRVVFDRRPATGTHPGAGDHPSTGPRSERVPARDGPRLIPAWALAVPRRAIALAAVLSGCAGFVAGGPVAAVAVAAYGGLAVRAVLRRQAAQRAVRERRRRLDGLCALAADLRAGLPMPTLISTQLGGGTGVIPTLDGGTRVIPNVPAGGSPATLRVPSGRAATIPPAGGSPAIPRASSGRAATIPAWPGGGSAPGTTGGELHRLDALTLAAGRLAEQTGAPLADLVDRVEADARAMDRGLAGAAAQAAGARATAWLLAALPLGGIALGYGIGVDPLDVLLHTPIGAGCALGAIVLQFAGLAWADRLSAGVTRAA